MNDIDALHRISSCFQKTSLRVERAQEILDTMEAALGYEYGAVLVIDARSKTLQPLALSKQGHEQDFLAQDKRYETIVSPKSPKTCGDVTSLVGKRNLSASSGWTSRRPTQRGNSVGRR